MLRIVFMGTPQFAVPTLSELLYAGHDVAAVYSQPPRAAGRGLSEKKSPIQVFAEQAGLTVKTPKALKSAEAQAEFAALAPDLAVVVAYGLILPNAILQAPRLGCFNLHASLLPRWRGAAPIQRAIMAGDEETGVMVMRIAEGLDEGPICLAERVPIGPNQTAGNLHNELSVIGAGLMSRALAALERDSLDCADQAETDVTYARKIEKAEARIDWSRDAGEVHNLVRGLSPFPGAWFEIETGGKRQRVKVLSTAREDGSGEPGEILDGDLLVACGEGAVRLIELQRAGKRPMAARDFLRGLALGVGTHLGG